jgi:hypothetical protein
MTSTPEPPIAEGTLRRQRRVTSAVHPDLLPRTLDARKSRRRSRDQRSPRGAFLSALFVSALPPLERS